MKITNDDSVSRPLPPGAPKEARTDAGAGKFHEILEEKLGKEKVSADSGVGRTSSPSGVSPIDTATMLGIDGTRVVDEAERLVGVLEEFQKKLADTGISTAELAPIVEKMNREKDRLIPALDALPPSDPMRAILNKVLIAVSVEAEKYERGDYV